MGIEPTLSAWEAEVLPLNYTRMNDNRELVIALAGTHGEYRQAADYTDAGTGDQSRAFIIKNYQ